MVLDITWHSEDVDDYYLIGDYAYYPQLIAPTVLNFPTTPPASPTNVVESESVW